MAYTLDNLRTDIRNYTEVGSNVLSDTVLERIIKNAELKIHRAIDTDQSVFYATSNAIIGNRYVTIPDNLRAIRYVQFKDQAGNQYYLEQRDTSFMAEYYATPGSSSTSIPKYYAENAPPSDSKLESLFYSQIIGLFFSYTTLSCEIFSFRIGR